MTMSSIATVTPLKLVTYSAIVERPHFINNILKFKFYFYKLSI